MQQTETKRKSRPRVFVEASFTFTTGLHTGIQRVVRKIVQPLVDGNAPPMDLSCASIQPVFLTDTGVFELDKGQTSHKKTTEEGAPIDVVMSQQLFKAASTTAAVIRNVVTSVPIPKLRSYMIAPRWKPGFSNEFYKAIQAVPVPALHRAFAPPASNEKVGDTRRLLRGIDYGPGDVFILLDSSWHLNIWGTVERLKAAGCVVIIVVYDLIPILHQDVVTTPLRDAFTAWIERTLTFADGYIGISNAVADDMRRFLAMYGRVGDRDPSKIPVSYFHLGAEFKSKAKSAADDRRPTTDWSRGPKALTAGVPAPGALEEGSFYLMVGTLEPRKRHLMVLDAFETLWAKGFKAKLVFAGVWGWLSAEDKVRIEAHPQAGKLLLHYSQASDSELHLLYARSRAVIQASKAEGFGLPIIEAAYYGKRVICTDLPVFREVAHAGAMFFERDSVEDLAKVITKESKMETAPHVPGKIKVTTWDESREWLLRESLKLAASTPATRAKKPRRRPRTSA